MVPTVVKCQKKTLFHNPSKLGNVELHREKQVILLQDFSGLSECDLEEFKYVPALSSKFFCQKSFCS